MTPSRCMAAMAVMLAALGAVSCASGTHGPRPAVESIGQRSQSAQQQSSETPAGSQQQAVPAYLIAACGHPGVQATLLAVPITIPRDQCDLTGVVVL
jgi:hypothetical protein